MKDIIGKDTAIAVINNAKDDNKELVRKESVDEVLEFLKSLNVKAVEIDLREFFGKPISAIEDALDKYSFVWVAGGNTFILRRAMKQSRCDEVLIRRVADGSLAYGGESAGAILATPSLFGVEFGDEPNLIPEGYEQAVIMDGLGLVQFHIVPHFQSEWIGADAMLDALEQKNLEYKKITDDQVIVIDGAKVELL